MPGFKLSFRKPVPFRNCCRMTHARTHDFGRVSHHVVKTNFRERRRRELKILGQFLHIGRKVSCSTTVFHYSASACRQLKTLWHDTLKKTRFWERLPTRCDPEDLRAPKARAENFGTVDLVYDNGCFFVPQFQRKGRKRAERSRMALELKLLRVPKAQVEKRPRVYISVAQIAFRAAGFGKVTCSF